MKLFLILKSLGRLFFGMVVLKSLDRLLLFLLHSVSLLPSTEIIDYNIKLLLSPTS